MHLSLLLLILNVQANDRYLRSVHDYRPPSVSLIDQDGRSVPLSAVLPSEERVVVEFVFTTCNSICPVLSATFSGLQRKLRSDIDRVRLVSISIDPERDRPIVLKRYADKFGAGPNWRFYTGSANDIRSILTAFEALNSDKSNHRPITLIRGAGQSSWVRIEGFLGAEELARELASVAAPLGASIYRDGVLSSGQNVEAIVEGDVPVTGAQLGCVVCHGRSGLGSVEGQRVVPPLSRKYLETPRRTKARPRPPYDRRSLARAIREGIDAGGNTLDPMMPRYQLGDEDMNALLDYLPELSARYSPGADEHSIHFATVIAPGAQAEDEHAMLDVIEHFFRAKNAGLADMRNRHLPSWPDYYGEWVHHVWRLKGSAATWPAQLAALERAQPVFALVSGIGAKKDSESWRTVHRFCESRAIPCLLPNVDTPPRGEDYYSMYFSRGTDLEASAIAAHLARAGATSRTIVVAPLEGDGARAARALAELIEAQGGEVFALPSNAGAQALARNAERMRANAVVLWLGAKDLRRLAREARRMPALPVYVSSTLLGGELDGARALGAAQVLAVHPYAIPREIGPRFRRVEAWLKAQGVERVVPGTERLVDQTFFALMMLKEGVMHMNKNLYREYFLEKMDHVSGFDAWSTYYPHLSFGPGQRHLSKGCNIVPLADDSKSEWIVP